MMCCNVFDALLDVLGAFWCASEMYLAHWCDVLGPRVLLWVWAVLVMFWGYVSRMLICNFIWNSFGMVWVRVVMYLECVWEVAGDLGVTRQRFGMRSGRNCRCAVFVGYSAFVLGIYMGSVGKRFKFLWDVMAASWDVVNSRTLRSEMTVKVRR